MPVQIQLRHDTGANWTSADPTLALGEIGVETDASPVLFKVGDGSTAWTGLAYTGSVATLDALLALSGGENISDALTGAASPSATNVFATMADTGGGGGVTVEDEGSPLATVADTLNFVGSGVTASGTGTTKTITIPGSGVTEITDIPTAETNTSKVLKPDGAGGVEWGTGGAGSGNVSAATAVEIDGLAGSPDALPGSPSAYDDEFNALSGWTTWGSLDRAANVTDYPSNVHLVKSGSGIEINGIYKACPSLPFTVSMHISAAAQGGNYDIVGLFITDSTPTAAHSFSRTYNTSDANTFTYESSSWSSRTSRGAVANLASASGRANWYPFLRMVVSSGTSIAFYGSLDGIFWYPIATGVNPGFTAANIGIYLGPFGGGGTTQAVVDWIRFT